MTTTSAAGVGTVYSRSWGYDQTNVDFYEIVSVSKTGKTGKARKIRSALVSAHGTSDRVTADTSAERFDIDSGCARCSNRHEGSAGWDGHAFTTDYTWKASTDQVTVTSYGDHAYRWDGRPMYQTGYGFGH
jgi:hypothetical protein